MVGLVWLLATVPCGIADDGLGGMLGALGKWDRWSQYEAVSRKWVGSGRKGLHSLAVRCKFCVLSPFCRCQGLAGNLAGCALVKSRLYADEHLAIFCQVGPFGVKLGLFANRYVVLSFLVEPGITGNAKNYSRFFSSDSFSPSSSHSLFSLVTTANEPADNLSLAGSPPQPTTHTMSKSNGIA